MDFAKLMWQKDLAIGNLTNDIEELFKKNKVDYIIGHGSFISENEINIELNYGGTRDRVKAKHIIIATGSESVQMPTLPTD